MSREKWGFTGPLGECKWSVRPVGTDVYDGLQAKAALVAQEARASDVRFALGSRTGFTAAMKRRARQEGVLLFDLKAVAGGRAD